MRTAPYLSTKEAALEIGISEQRVRTLLRCGDIEGHQVGKVWVIAPGAVQDYINRTKGPTDRKNKEIDHQAVKAISFFSGAMGLDLGFEKAGIEISLACEVDKHCRQTIIADKPPYYQAPVDFYCSNTNSTQANNNLAQDIVGRINGWSH